MRLNAIFDRTLNQVKSWSRDDQFDFAKRVAANVGYKLTPDTASVAESTLEDRVAKLEQVAHEPYDFTELVARVEALEVVVRELNPGWSGNLSLTPTVKDTP